MEKSELIEATEAKTGVIGLTKYLVVKDQVNMTTHEVFKAKDVENMIDSIHESYSDRHKLEKKQTDLVLENHAINLDLLHKKMNRQENNDLYNTVNILILGFGLFYSVRKITGWIIEHDNELEKMRGQISLVQVALNKKGIKL